MSEKKYSGAQKRKAQREKEKKEQQLLKKIPKLMGYFKAAESPLGCHGQDDHPQQAEVDSDQANVGVAAVSQSKVTGRADNDHCTSPCFSEVEFEGLTSEPPNTLACCASSVPGVSYDVPASANPAPASPDAAETRSSDPA
ncbi:Hypothetical predicted protein [Scomber scombrus]|uniref:Uncharacterized protein n=1 Tax=Scomber scombrus TaxID=13677 RepID=A0AAV1NQX1_SCOSC